MPNKKQGIDHLGDAVGYLVSYLYPIKRETQQTPQKRFNVQLEGQYGRL